MTVCNHWNGLACSGDGGGMSLVHLLPPQGVQLLHALMVSTLPNAELPQRCSY